MTIDLQDLYNEAGRDAPAHNLDGELEMRRGRRVRARRRVAVGATTLVGVGVVAAGSVALAGNAPGSDPLRSAVGPASGSGTSDTPPADLVAVALPDPAPGFPIRRWRDSVGLEPGPPGQAAHWSATFGLAATPPKTETDAAGNVTAYPTGPEVTIFVNRLPIPELANGTLEGHPVIATPTVAGVTGHVTSYRDKGTPVGDMGTSVRELYFSTGKFSVKVVGFDGVSTAELVTLGNSLTGLQ
jgi:hypothetical protein